MEPNLNTTNNSSRSKAVELHPIFVLLILIIVLGGGYLLWQGTANKAKPTPKFSTENVQIKSIDLATATGANRVPTGLPKDLPLELNNVTESNTLTYPDKNLILYSVSYTSTKKLTDLSTTYSSYLKTAGYTVTKTNKTASSVVYLSSKGTTDLNIMITTQPKNELVQISYTVKQ